MHKKLASDLTSLAHSILQMKNKEDVVALKEKACEVYEKLALLAFVEEYINTTPNAEETKEELIQKIEKAAEVKEENIEKVIIEKVEEIKEEAPVEDVQKDVLELVENNFENVDKVAATEDNFEEPEMVVVRKLEDVEKPIEEGVETETKPSVIVEEIVEQPFEELENLLFGEPEPDKEDPEINKATKEVQPTLEEELQDTLPVDVMADLFQKVEPKKTINDLLQDTIKIDLNDRIAFVNHLFGGDQANFNRVVSQLNTFKTEREAKNFISKMVKPDYDWSDKQGYEIRLLEIIERRFA
ncbi:hypothetical protein BTO06_14845 [Tenacibaculum sp. SZ-18]|uniref:hypothetical protein n=1 Tax=Tenacibaculum sp. SZ-18 TaxID=754423 RepID=UPI000C2CFF85|nr:hypothetical protein [Tenacibaculum sp. SZ-18]AUC16349.1 hypothetical protein BTO06_14845 [Tenacibaculum sp. SZ-18]